MSWSFYGVGKPGALANKAIAELGRIKCAEPEETVKRKVEEIILASLGACPDGCAVQIIASGSQSTDSEGKATNQLSLEIKPLYGFVEE